jgi:hypothetical protein
VVTKPAKGGVTITEVQISIPHVKKPVVYRGLWDADVYPDKESARVAVSKDCNGTPMTVI